MSLKKPMGLGIQIFKSISDTSTFYRHCGKLTGFPRITTIKRSLKVRYVMRPFASKLLEEAVGSNFLDYGLGNLYYVGHSKLTALKSLLIEPSPARSLTREL